MAVGDQHVRVRVMPDCAQVEVWIEDGHSNYYATPCVLTESLPHVAADLVSVEVVIEKLSAIAGQPFHVQGQASNLALFYEH
jgi:hypothetical protein